MSGFFTYKRRQTKELDRGAEVPMSWTGGCTKGTSASSSGSDVFRSFFGDVDAKEARSKLSIAETELRDVKDELQKTKDELQKTKNKLREAESVAQTIQDLAATRKELEWTTRELQKTSFELKEAPAYAQQMESFGKAYALQVHVCNQRISELEAGNKRLAQQNKDYEGALRDLKRENGMLRAKRQRVE